jgi:hypothetical protein
MNSEPGPHPEPPSDFRWSRAIYEHPDHLKVHGILYPARHNHTRSAVAIFDREGLPRIEVNRTVSWHPPEGDMRPRWPPFSTFTDSVL